MRFPLFMLLLFAFAAFRSDTPVAVKKIAARNCYFTSDAMGNLYIARGENLEKYDQNGNLVRIFSDKTLGQVSTVDATNPLRLVVFYRDFSQVIFLDNTLTRNGSGINLQELGFPAGSLVSQSFDNGTWFYDQQNFELLRLDKDLNIAQRTGNLGQQLNMDLKPNALLESGNYVFLNNPQTGILLFDVFGTYYKTIPAKGLTDFQVRGDDVFYGDSTGMSYRYVIKTNTLDSLRIAPGKVNHARLEKERLFILQHDTLTIFRR